ncbi:mechanosensitive ion channel domain-containing protein [Motiliproteus sediminis]|uniref:mechanosensitive ion channel domain-containing protein n=1 Tax=Motiliproteus sediminis TaxID=1468178 RepID=UPI001AEF9E48|nr:mechanosensitive ion channel domain-containing protein [Motiliproteus sediminis]
MTGRRNLACSVVITAVVMLLGILSGHATGAENVAPLPQTERIEERLQQLEARQDADASLLKETYNDILRRLNNIRSNREQSALYSQVIERYPQRLQQLQRQLIKGSERDQTQPKENSTLADLQQQQALNSTRLVELESDLDALAREVAAIDTRQQLLPEQLTQARNRLSSLTTANLSQNGGGEQADAQRMLANTHQEELSTRIKMLELEQLSSANRRELAQAEQQLVKHRISAVQQRTEQLQQAIAERRQQQTEQLIEQSRQRDPAPTTTPLIRYALNQTEEYSSELKRLSAAITATSAQQVDLLGRQRAVDALQKEVSDQLNATHSTTTAGASLRAKLSRLPARFNQRAIKKQLDQAQLGAYRIEQQASLLSIPDDYVLQYENQTGHSATKNGTRELLPILESQQDLTSRLIQNYNSYISELARLDQAAGQLNQSIDKLRGQITEHLLWLPNTLPVGSHWIMQVSGNLKWLLNRIEPGLLLDALGTHSDRVLSALLLLALTAGLHRIGQQRLPALAQRHLATLGNVTTDHFGTTLHLAAAITLYALPLPLFLYGSGRLIDSVEPLSLANGIGQGLGWTALLLYIYRWWYLAAAPQGLLRQHFGWNQIDFDTLRRHIRAPFWVAVPLLILIAIGEDHDNTHLNNGIGRAAFILLCIATAYLYGVIINRLHLAPSAHDQSHSTALEQVLKVLLPALPLGCALLAAYGYFFTGIKLLLTLQQTLLLIAGGLIVYALGIRWLLIAERRMAFNRAKVRRAEQQAQRAKAQPGEDERPAEILEENLIDLRTVSEHSKVLLRTVVIIGAATLVGVLWAEVFRALNFLDQITIWESGVLGENGEATQPVTLKEILFSIAMIGLTLIAVRNLPGVMEILILQHLQLAPGTGYALTTLLKYLLVTTGTLFSFDLLGFEWSKLQWLVAALGVGLGFGLQEIFANFVSGLILLFEKPIRIGDTVTINELSGTVTKIKIRATTIVDWDRKEIIVPNKAFITEQLVNWSLSDAITRQIISVGVAYGSDNKLVTRLLLEAAETVPQVLSSPKPEAYFVAFGASSLDFELRVFVNDLSYRFPVRHALNERINSLFREHQIEIAFPQLDVHLKRN